MLRLQNEEVIYNNSENLGDVKDMSYIDGGFIITLTDGTPTFISEEECTESEQEVFIAYHEYYKDTGGVKPTNELSLEMVKLLKIKELNDSCTSDILSGFEHLHHGNTYLMGFDEQDQSNLTQQMAIISISTEPIVWKVKGELVFLQFTRDEFQQMGLVAKQHKESKMQRYYLLCGQVQACTTKEEIEAISW